MAITDHPFLQQVMTLMDLQPGDRILELDCGDGWACRRLAGHIPEGLIIGLDPSDDNIRDARAKSTSFENILYLWSAAEQIPWQEDFFTGVFCIDSICYFQDLDQVFREVHRVLVPGGTFWIVEQAQREEGEMERMASDLTTPVRPLTTEDQVTRLRQCGYQEVSLYSLPSPSPDAPARAGQEPAPGGALLLSARKLQ